MNPYSLSHLRGRALESSFDRVASVGAESTALQLAHLTELDRQGYYLDAGCRSMFRYCVDRKRMSEDVAVQWIRVARVAREHPRVFGAIATGALTVSAVHLLARHLTEQNEAELLAAAAGRSNKQVSRMLAERFGRRSVLEAFPNGPGASLTSSMATSAESPVSIRVTGEALLGLTSPGPLGTSNAACAVVPVAAAGRCADDAQALRARLTALGNGRFELVAILGQEAFEQLEAARQLLGGVPGGALVELLQQAIALLHADLRKRRCAATDRPRTAVDARGEVVALRGAGSGKDAAPRRVGTSRPTRSARRIPAAVRRAVWERDGGRCTYVSPDGHRCEEREQLELDHVLPVARGGHATVENLRLLCRAHNRQAAEREFGREAVRARIEAARSRRAAERMRREADRERTEARRAAMTRQDEELGTALRNLGYRGMDLRRALALCADRADAPPEARLRHALGCMAPRARRETAEGGGAAA